MNQKKLNIEMIQAYKNIINIELFNKIISFIIETTNINCNNFIQKLKQKNIWFEKTENSNIQEEYGFKYFGELLERYEQRIGTDIKDIRAISLALSYSKELVTDDMITGTQLVDFINKIKRLSENDIYLKGSLYIYDQNKYYNLFEDIINQNFTKTEDIVFTLSLFYDIKQGFDILEPQLNNLLGKSKTISVLYNCGIYNWLINNLYPIIKNSRKKGIELFRAFITIPTVLVKKNSKEYKVLVENGYTLEEISFLNYICIFYSTIPKTVRIGKSLVEEKIAIELCINILNSEFSYPENIYNLISTMLSDYYNFDIKCYGATGIKEAIKYYVNIKVPQTFIKFYRNLDKSLFSFDILDSKWDVVKESMDLNDYRDLFDDYLLFSDFDKEQIELRINKYNELTNTSYLSTFNVFRYGRSNIYSKLVQTDVISLKDTFDKYLAQKNNQNDNSKEKTNIDLEHLQKYIKDIENRKAFEFIKYFLSINNHTIKDLEKYHFSLDNLYNNHYRYYSSRPTIDIKRKFLSAEEERELLSWLESFIFYTQPNQYMNFVYSILEDDFIETILSKEELRNIYFTLMEFNNNLKKDTSLRQKFLTHEELKQIEKEELEEKEREKFLERQALENEVTTKFHNIENLNFKSIYEYCYSYRWEKEKTSVACRLVKEYLEHHIEEQNFILEQVKYFNKICNLLIEQNAITTEKIKNYTFRYFMEGELVA